MRSKQTAKVKWFNDKKGFGFLTDQTGGDVLSITALIQPGTDVHKTLLEGQGVEYLPVETDKGISVAEVFPT